MQWKGAFPDKSYLWAYGQVLQGKIPPSRGGRSTRRGWQQTSNVNSPAVEGGINGGRSTRKIWDRALSYPASILSSAVSGKGNTGHKSTTSAQGFSKRGDCETKNGASSTPDIQQSLSHRSASSPALMTSSRMENDVGDEDAMINNHSPLVEKEQSSDQYVDNASNEVAAMINNHSPLVEKERDSDQYVDNASNEVAAMINNHSPIVEKQSDSDQHVDNASNEVAAIEEDEPEEHSNVESSA